MVSPTPREYPTPLFKLRRLQGGRGRHAYESRQKLDVLSCVAVLLVVIFSQLLKHEILSG